MTTFQGYPIERFPAIHTADGRDGCRESHLSILRIAKERGYPFVLILEDDCAIHPNFPEEFAKVWDILFRRRTEWDVFNGGPSYLRNLFPLEGNVFRVSLTLGTGCILVNGSAYDKILQHHMAPKDTNIDVYYSNFRQCTSGPPLTYQRDTLSDITPGISYAKKFEYMYTYLSTFATGDSSQILRLRPPPL